MKDLDKNGIPDLYQNIILMIVGIALITAGISGIYTNTDSNIIITLCSLGTFILSGERVKTYLEKR
ncbi:MAG: hypothetical protein JJE19_08860 [Methanosarcinales archaeon]|nr:hypothetical protein [Methanosarcinales archaeon]